MTRHYYDPPEPPSATDLLRLGRELTATTNTLRRAQQRREAKTLFTRLLAQKRAAGELARLERRLGRLTRMH